MPPAASRRAGANVALRELSRHLREVVGGPGQPLHHHLSTLYDCAEAAEAEIRRTCCLLGLVESGSEVWREPLLGKVTVILPPSEPLFTMVSHVVVPALVCAQVRAVSAHGPTQRSAATIFAWLAESVRAPVEACADGSAQQWHDARLGNITLVHAPDGDSATLQSLALAARPHAIIWATSVRRARAMSLAAGGCPIIMPRPLAHIVQIGPPGPRRLPDEPAGLAARAIALDLGANRHRACGVPDVVLVHDLMVQSFLGQWVRQARPWTDVEIRRLSPATDVGDLLGGKAADGARPRLRLLTYSDDRSLAGLLSGLSEASACLSLFGVSGIAEQSLPPTRLYANRTRGQVEEAVTAGGQAADLHLCELMLNGFVLHSSYSLLGLLQECTETNARGISDHVRTWPAGSGTDGGADGPRPEVRR